LNSKTFLKLNKNKSNFFNSTKPNIDNFQNINIPLLTEANKTYFKININNKTSTNTNTRTNSKSNLNNRISNSKSNKVIVSKFSKKYKIYRKPSKPKNMTCFQQSFKDINEKRKNEKIIPPDSVSLNSQKNDKENNDKKEQKEQKEQNTNLKVNANENLEVKKDASNNKKNSLLSKDVKEEDNALFSNSIDESNQFGPRISINKKQREHPDFYYLDDKSNDENNNNGISFKENISPIESLESYRINDDKNINKKNQINSENLSIEKCFDNYVRLPISEYLYMTKEKKIICKNLYSIKIDEIENGANTLLKDNVQHKKIKIPNTIIKYEITFSSADKNSFRLSTIVSLNISGTVIIYAINIYSIFLKLVELNNSIFL
jgi:hypothetical protein